MTDATPGRPPVAKAARDVKIGERWIFGEHKTCAEWGAPVQAANPDRPADHRIAFTQPVFAVRVRLVDGCFDLRGYDEVGTEIACAVHPLDLGRTP